MANCGGFQDKIYECDSIFIDFLQNFLKINLAEEVSLRINCDR
ncbi:MAG: hypothetical protein WBF90_04660 [Rivularia sp. (in: cyanobacteria)]